MSRRTPTLPSLLAFAALTVVPSVAADPPKRTPWTSSKIIGSPEPPPPFKVVRVFPKLRFQNPLLCAFAPNSDRCFIAEQSGKIFSFLPKENVERGDLFIDLAKEIKTVAKTPNAKDFENVYGLAFHPKFAENRKCYICYTLRSNKPGEKNLPDGSRVSEFTVRATEPPTVDAASERILLTFLQGGHNGGDLHFGPDGFLYITTGDATDPNPPDVFRTGQDCSDLLSSILRIDVDRRDPGKECAIPKDNPFVGMPKVRPEIWAFGFRNPWRMSFDKKTGDLWVGDVGWELWEMVYRVSKGGNYGWSIVEGRQPINTEWPKGPGPILSPTIELNHSIAASVTGGYVYRGKKFPELEGQYIFGDWETRRLWAATTKRDKPVTYREIAEPSIRLVAFGEDRAGEIYLVDYDTGTLHGLERNVGAAANATFPTKLAETGLFSDVKSRRLAEGVQPFAINAKQWADGADAEYCVGLPGDSRIVWHPKDVPIQGSMFSRQFEFPANAVLAKTVLWPSATDEQPPKPIETQVLHYDGKQWRGYSYVWNDAATDADLAPPDGLEKKLQIADSRMPNGKRQLKWTVPSRTQCLQCHNPWAQTTLAFNVPQLHGSRAALSRSIARLRSSRLSRARLGSLNDLYSAGLLDRRDDQGRPTAEPADSDWAKFPTLSSMPHQPIASDSNQVVEEAARTYLHVNCAHCHRMGGGGGVDFQIPKDVALKDSKTLDVRPARGGFGLHDPRIIATGDPLRSVLYYRMAKSGSGRMPHLGSDLPDEAGLALISQWIRSLTPVKAMRQPPDVERSFLSVGGAMELARAVSDETFMNPQVRNEILAKAARAPDPNIRDLFEHLQPLERRRQTLGNQPKSASILALKGDAVRGRDLFWNASALQCKTCHRIGVEGINLGPDLTKIASQRSRQELLENVLTPSAKIEPNFTSYVLLTKDGVSTTGLLVKRDSKEVVLRDAKNQEVRVAVGDIERLVPSKTSIMPDGLLRDLTAQEAADLLEYLSGLK